ncbi:unnamed protein product [Hymenolepis diminuta]|uniref:Uncharacterized protein n=1 Tax=Hymenolepis diminuta TaxID=6216 RepID=A0A564Z6R9_HYMDI|nr:unnamed protein product [Hymenolepis diminuta]
MQVGFSSMSTWNCSELSFFECSTLGSPFRLKSSFLKCKGENQFLQVFTFTISFLKVSLSILLLRLQYL